MATNVHYVSVIVYNPTDPIIPEKRLAWLRTLFDAQLPMTLFIDDYFRKALEAGGWFSEANHPELRLVDWSLESSDVWKCSEGKQLQMPETRNEGKDGEFFLKLMNAKPELVARVAGEVEAPFVAFLDAGIVKIFKDVEGSLRRLKGLRMKEGGVVIPGCWAPGVHSQESLSRRICWVFCGGFFVIGREEAAGFAVAALKAFQEFMGVGRLTWEVNVWVQLLLNPGAPKMKWFEADHNDRMTMVPEAWQETRSESTQTGPGSLFQLLS